MKRIALVLIVLFSIKLGYSQNLINPDTVAVQSGGLILKGLLWRPSGSGPFPTLIFSHGSYGGLDTVHNPIQQTSLLGPLFAQHGYIFLVLFRRGVGLSYGQGENSTLLMEKAFRERGQGGRNDVQLQQMETTQLQDMVSGLGFLRKRNDVDTNHIGIIGHSFGGSLALLLAEFDSNLKAVVIFSGGGYSWDLSPQLRERLFTAAKNINLPVMLIHAQNDYSINPGYAIDSVRRQLYKPDLLKIYPKFGNTQNDGHNLIFQGIETWKDDVLEFLDENLQR